MLCGLFLCVSSATDWQPIQGVSCLFLSDSQYRLQPPNYPELEKWKRMDGHTVYPEGYGIHHL